ncbi:MAG: hypothetical protein EON93_20330, partial [Burkholderiales bacterium]
MLVALCLHNLGLAAWSFQLHHTSMEWPFVIGRRYNRRNELHQPFGGSQQNGMISLPRFHAIALVT